MIRYGGGGEGGKGVFRFVWKVGIDLDGGNVGGSWGFFI